MTVLFLTFISYTSFHLSRKSLSVVKPVLLDCPDNQTTCTSYITEINGESEAKAKSLISALDTSFLVSYAFFMFFSGYVAERMNLRYFLALGMLTSGLFTFALGLAKSIGIHSIYYFIIMQIFAGAVQSTGWPGVVTAVANWFGKSKKGALFGIWNSHTSVGNILGSIIAGAYVEQDWGVSFMLPGFIIGAVGMINWFFLVPSPKDVGLQTEDENERSELIGADESTALLTENEEEGLEEEEVEIRPVEPEDQAISFVGALKIPGVVEFSLCLFFAKLVSYTFLYWLPTFIKESGNFYLQLFQDFDTLVSYALIFQLEDIQETTLTGIQTELNRINDQESRLIKIKSQDFGPIQFCLDSLYRCF